MKKQKKVKSEDTQLNLFTPRSQEETEELERKKAKKKESSQSIAEVMASKQREISVSEFFSKNRHLLGFDNPKKALLTTIKEAVDNSLDACEEAGILPEVTIVVQAVPEKEDRFIISVEDNGPGIVKSQIPKIFAKLLYGSKFHRLKMSRGQQGIGISAAGMYGQLTTGKPFKITSKIANKEEASYMELRIDTKSNKPQILVEEDIDVPHESGTKVEIELIAKYTKGRQSIDDYLKQTAIANPHVTIHFYTPEGEIIHMERTMNEMPPQPREIKPHPYGVELGVLQKMLYASQARTLSQFLSNDFSRVSQKTAMEILEAAGIPNRHNIKELHYEEIEALYKALQKVKIMNPPTDCVVPIGEEAIIEGLKRYSTADFYSSVTRSPSVYRGNPFRIEVGIAYGGSDKPLDEPATLLRFANRVPLLYQQSACNMNKGVIKTDWRNYNLQQPKGSLPFGPLTIMLHIASVWVPFTSESKEALADYPEITKEVILALQEAGRKLGTYVRHKRIEFEQARKQGHIQKYIPHITIALTEMLKLNDKQQNEVTKNLLTILERGGVNEEE